VRELKSAIRNRRMRETKTADIKENRVQEEDAGGRAWIGGMGKWAFVSEITSHEDKVGGIGGKPQLCPNLGDQRTFCATKPIREKRGG